MRLVLSAHLPFSLTAVVRAHGWADLVPFVRTSPLSMLWHGMSRRDELSVNEIGVGIPGLMGYNICETISSRKRD